tara:strand:- start:144 stop:431 length:288 start_codon:yes stop_codon:yes gene_type:complete
VGNNLKIKKESMNKSWPFIKSADTLSFLNNKIDIKHNIVDLVGHSIYSAYEGRPQKFSNVLDRARFSVGVNLPKDYGITFDYEKDDYKLKFTKDF